MPGPRARLSGKGSRLSPFDRQDRDAVFVRKLALAHRIFELHAEYLARADTTFCGERAAEHRPARLQRMAAHEIFRRAHRGDRAFLVELAVGPRAQHELLPVRLDVVIAPGLAVHGLRAELLGERYADGR